MDRMDLLWLVADDHVRAGESVSTIAWIGYDAPQSIVPEAMNRRYSHDAAPHLARFMEGLATAQGGRDSSNTTLIGHSYGSSVIGVATSRGEPIAADSIIAVGSPGMQVPHARDLGISEENVWSMTAPLTSDPVPVGMVVHGEPRGFFRTSRFGLPYIDPSGWLGSTAPSKEDFGANRLRTDATDHGDYWRYDDDDKPSLSLLNQALVVIGDGHRAERAR